MKTESFLGLVKRLHTACAESRVGVNSASLAYYMLFAIVPFGISTGYLVSSLPVSEDGFFFYGGILRAVLSDTKPSGALAGGVAVSVVSLARFINNLKKHISPHEKTGGVKGFITSLVRALVSLSVFYLWLVALVFGRRAAAFVGSDSEELVMGAGVIILPFVFFTLAYLDLSPVGTLKSSAAGAAFCTLGWSVLTGVGARILDSGIARGRSGVEQMLYLMTFLYALSFFVLVGGEINRILSDTKARAGAEPKGSPRT